MGLTIFSSTSIMWHWTVRYSGNKEDKFLVEDKENEPYPSTNQITSIGYTLSL